LVFLAGFLVGLRLVGYGWLSGGWLFFRPGCSDGKAEGGGGELKQGNVLVEGVGEGALLGGGGGGATNEHGLLGVGFQVVQKRGGVHKKRIK
jgi:hypothetical protein